MVSSHPELAWGGLVCTGVIYFFCNSWKADLWNHESLVPYNYRSLWFLLFCGWFLDFCKTNTQGSSVYKAEDDIIFLKYLITEAFCKYNSVLV